MILHPVIFPVPKEKSILTGKNLHTFLSVHAREALKKCAQINSISFTTFEKDKRNVPIPFSGYYWSLAHKPKFVCAVISKQPVGIDVEEVSLRKDGMFARVAEHKEWKTFSEKNWEIFAQIWSAKEAVLKATGEGVSGLKNCKVIDQEKNGKLKLHFQGKVWWVDHLKKENHIFALTCDKDDQIEWNLD